MAVNKLNTNKETYDKIIAFLPKIQNKTRVDIETIKELHSIGQEAGYIILRNFCAACDNQKIIKHLEAYQYQYEEKYGTQG